MKVLFTLREDKTDRAGLAPVFVCASFDGLRLQTTTKEKCRPADWNRDKQQFRRSLPGYQDANDYLQALTLRLHASYRELRAAGTAPTLALMREAVHPVVEVAPPAEPTLLELFAEYWEVLRGRGFAFNTLRHHGTSHNWLQKLEQHRGKQPFYLADYTLTRHDEFIHFLRLRHGLGPNGIYSIIKDIKKFLRHLQQERDLTLAIDLSRMQVLWTDVPKHFLSAADLSALATATIPATLVPVRDVFLFCCYTGLRYFDVQQLQPANLHTWNGHRILKLVQTKTRCPVSIYLTAAAEAILERYANTDRLRLLPVYANQVMNRGLKRLGQLAGLTAPVKTMQIIAGQVVKASVPAYELLTMHTARHTFATQSLLRGVSSAVLQRVMGHSKLQTTMHYAKMVEDFQHQALQLAWDGPAAAASPLVAGEVCVAATAA